MNFVTVKQGNHEYSYPADKVRSVHYRVDTRPDVDRAKIDIYLCGVEDSVGYFTGTKDEILAIYQGLARPEAPGVILVGNNAIRRDQVTEVSCYDSEPPLFEGGKPFKDRVVVRSEAQNVHIIDFETREQRDAEYQRILGEWKGR